MPKINELTSRECAAYIKSGGDLVFIPAASPERLGPHLPVGAGNIVAEIIADKFAEKFNALSLPLIPYNTVYHDFEGRGSIDIDVSVMNAYYKNLCDELAANKLRRIVFVSFHEELYYLCHEYFQEKNIAAAWLTPDKFFDLPDSAVSKLDSHGQELWRLAACLRMTKNSALLGKILARTEKHFGMLPPVNKALDMMRIFGATGYKTDKNEWRFYPVNLGESLPEKTGAFKPPSDETLDKAASELDRWLDSYGSKFKALKEYQKYLDANPFARLPI
jgi:creatinine amidohydrolase/Fe(II)-dependent formamide hydrolase-like protein